MRTISLIRKIIQKNSLLVARANLGVSPIRFHTLSPTFQSLSHEGFEPVHDNLNRLLGLVFEQFEQRPGVALYATTSDKDGERFERVGEHIPLAPTVGRCGPFRAEDNASRLREGQIKRVERVAPEEEGSRVEGDALEQILYVDGGTSGRAIRNKVKCLGRRQVKDVKIGDAFLCEEWARDLATLGT